MSQQAIVSIAFSSPSKLSWVFLQLNKNVENLFSVSFKKPCDKKGKQLVNLDNENVNSHHHNVNSSYKFCVSIKLQKRDF